MFYIVSREPNGTETRPLSLGGADNEFACGQDAKARANELNTAAKIARLEVRYRVCREENPAKSDWRERERKRFKDGTYKGVPWNQEDWYLESPYADLHFPHVSTDDPSKIAFTESEEKGQQDRQTRILPGRYLTRFFGDVMGSDDIRDIAAEYAAQYDNGELHFATDADEIEEVYVTGPDSCMSHNASEYSSPCHPVRVYADSDLAVAYLRREGRITARAVVWPEKKRHTRLYGDTARLGTLLRDQGYERESLEGARIKRIEADDSFVVPYIDHPNSEQGNPRAHNCRDSGEFLVIDDGGEINCAVTDGISANDDRETCDLCGERCSGDDMYGVDGGEVFWCRWCLRDSGYTCDSCGDAYSGSAYIYVEDDNSSICYNCRDDYFCCATCNNSYHNRNIAGNTIHNETICRFCASELETAPCGRYIPENSAPNDACHCSQCEEQRNETEPELPLAASSETDNSFLDANLFA